MEILYKLLALAETLGYKLYLVGGAVRDVLNKEAVKDLDLVVVDPTGRHSQPAMELARLGADRLGGSFVPLDEKHGVARIVLPWGEPDIVDFARLQGATLEEDLVRRDFTVNAIALPVKVEVIAALVEVDLEGLVFLLHKWVIDPTQGMRDINAGIVRATGESALMKDPLRMLRAVRIAAMKGWRIEEETVELIRRHGPLLNQAARERLGEEFFKLLRQRDAASWVAYLVDELNLLPFLWPEIVGLQETKQNYHHQVDAWTHCLTALEEMEEMLVNPDFFPPDLGEAVADYGRQVLVKGKSTRAMLWKFIALFHDVGKTVTARQREDGRISFFGHDLKGSEMIREMGRKLALSGKELALAEKVVKGHMRPLQLAGCKPLSKRAAYRFFRDYGKNAVDVLVISLADHGAKAKFKGETGYEFRDFVFGLLRRYYYQREQVLPEPLLSGRELGEAFPQVKGREIGRWLEMLMEAQVEGLVKDKEEALRFIGERLYDKKGILLKM
ncbi:MAG: HDIG domain-containing protein [Clostridia bacterium]|nr:HDIG domain-containing protein [Clostridia bacterium]